MSRASSNSFPMTLVSENCDETIASPTGSEGPVAATAAAVAATADHCSEGRGAAACLGRSGAPEGASGKATSASGGDPTGLASSGEVRGHTGSVIVEASRCEGGRAGAAGAATVESLSGETAGAAGGGAGSRISGGACGLQSEG